MKNINYIKWLLSYSKHSTKDLFFYCLIGLLMVAVWIIIPIYMSKLTLSLTNGSWADLYHIALLIFVLHFFYNILKVLISNFALKFITETYRNLHLDISQKFMNTSITGINSKNSSFFLNRLTDDTIDVSDFFINITDDIIDILINVSYLITIFVLNKFIFFFYLYFLILLFIIENSKTSQMIDAEKLRKENVQSLMNTNIEMIRGIEEIKLLNIKNNFLRIIDSKIKKFSKSLIKLDNIERFYRFIYSNITNIFRLLLVGLCIYLISNNLLTIPIALLAINYENDIFSLLQSIESIMHNIKKFQLCANRIMEITSYQATTPEIYGEKKITDNNITCEIQDLSFAYQKNKTILNNLSLTIKPKERIALVGLSGTGKTSILNLINRLYLPTKGKITFNGININDLTEKSLRDLISVVTQNPYLFNMTIKENLKLVKENATDKEIEEACKLAQIAEDIKNMPEGYDTMIEEAGKNLSGGQKQRLAIARVILRNTPIILFDEATSALDNETERKLYLALNKMQGKFTTITVAHRLSTIINSDCIYFLKNTKISTSGTHSELLKSCKEYKKLYEKELQ